MTRLFHVVAVRMWPSMTVSSSGHPREADSHRDAAVNFVTHDRPTLARVREPGEVPIAPCHRFEIELRRSVAGLSNDGIWSVYVEEIR